MNFRKEKDNELKFSTHKTLAKTQRRKEKAPGRKSLTENRQLSDEISRGGAGITGQAATCFLLPYQRLPWEVTGYVPNVVFTCGAVPEDDGTVKIYWGGADTVMCAGTAVIDDLTELCLSGSRPPL